MKKLKVQITLDDDSFSIKNLGEFIDEKDLENKKIAFINTINEQNTIKFYKLDDGIYVKKSIIIGFKFIEEE